MLNVLSIVSYQFLPAKMGGQKGIGLFNAYLAGLVNLACVTTRNNDPSLAEGYTLLNVLSNGKGRYINPFYFFRIRKIIRKQQITHIVIEHPYYGWLGILLKWFTKTKLIVHSHNIEALRFKSMNMWWWGILWNYEKYTHRSAHFSFFIQDDDRNYAIEQFGLAPEKCATITYGFEMDQAPSTEERLACKKQVCHNYGIPPGTHILLFNGTLDYKPNRDALDIIIEKINPVLLSNPQFPYRIIICGSKLPASYHALQAFTDKNIIYAGFVDDISLFFKGADIFINPVTDGGGIKTKVVEALGYDMAVVSTQSGAIGIPADITGDKLKIVADTNPEAFAKEIMNLRTGSGIPPEYFEHFYWGNIAAKAANCISSIPLNS